MAISFGRQMLCFAKFSGSVFEENVFTCFYRILELGHISYFCKFLGGKNVQYMQIVPSFKSPRQSALQIQNLAMAVVNQAITIVDVDSVDVIG